MLRISALVDVTIHESAIVEQGAQIGAGTSIWHFAHVRGSALVGRECMLGKDTYIGEKVRLGDRVRIQNGVSVFTGVTLEDEVFVGPAAVFTNDLFPRAVNLVEPDLRPTIVRHGASLGAGSIIVCGVEIGSFAMVGAGAVIVSDVAAYACVVGNPAHQIGWSCRCGRPILSRQSNPLELSCATCNRRYRQHSRRQTNGHVQQAKDIIELEYIDDHLDDRSYASPRINS